MFLILPTPGLEERKDRREASTDKGLPDPGGRELTSRRWTGQCCCCSASLTLAFFALGVHHSFTFGDLSYRRSSVPRSRGAAPFARPPADAPAAALAAADGGLTAAAVASANRPCRGARRRSSSGSGLARPRWRTRLMSASFFGPVASAARCSRTGTYPCCCYLEDTHGAREVRRGRGDRPCSPSATPTACLCVRACSVHRASCSCQFQAAGELWPPGSRPRSAAAPQSRRALARMGARASSLATASSCCACRAIRVAPVALPAPSPPIELRGRRAAHVERLLEEQLLSSHRTACSPTAWTSRGVRACLGPTASQRTECSLCEERRQAPAHGKPRYAPRDTPHRASRRACAASLARRRGGGGGG